MIKLQIIGHLGNDCQKREVGGTNVINFNVATTERFKNSSGVQQERTTWVRCAYWSDRTGIDQYLLKGKLVYVEGTPSVSSFKKQDGEPGATLELRVRSIELLGGKGDSSQGGMAAGASGQQPSGNRSIGDNAPMEEDTGADDLPF